MTNLRQAAKQALEMNREIAIRLAREAGAVFPADGSWHKFETEGSLERFAALVAAHEREECAKVVDDWYNSLASEPEMAYIAAEIRSRT